jgi:zinc finger SWIM domain-containing protein 3
MYNIDDKIVFEEEFDIMSNNMEKKKATWLCCIYKLKEKIGKKKIHEGCFLIGNKSTQLSESFNSDLKKHLKSDFNIVRFLKHFERVVQGKKRQGT